MSDSVAKVQQESVLQTVFEKGGEKKDRKNNETLVKHVKKEK